jgi:hypothetical protein
MTPPVPGSRRPCYSPVRCRATRMEAHEDDQQPNHPRISALSGRRPRARRHVRRSARLVRVRRQAERLDPRSGKTVRSIDVAAHAERPSTASTCSRSPRIASRRSIRRPAACLATIPAPGGGVNSGLAWAEGDALGGAVSGAEDPSDRSPIQGRFFAPIESTASSPGSPGSMASSGTAPGKVTRAMCGGSDLPTPERSLERLEMPPGVGLSRARSPMVAIGSSAEGGNSGKVRAIRRPQARLDAQVTAPLLTSAVRQKPHANIARATNTATQCLHAAHVGESAKTRAAWFPPPLRGRDREGVVTKALHMSRSRFENDSYLHLARLFHRRHEPEAALLYPSPCPSPTRQGNRMWAQISSCEQ